MTHLRPNINVKVDVTNPGQFFACCGLLELADRLWPSANITSEFTPPIFQRSQFRIFSNRRINTRTIVKLLCASKRTPSDPYRPIKKNGKPVKDIKKIMPICLEISENGSLQNERVSVRLNWWLDEVAGQQLDNFKLWSAHVSSESLINDMANEIEPEKIDDETLLEYSKGMTGRIGLDARSSWNTLDEGFSPNNQSLRVETFPATELLAAIGLQNFVPIDVGNGYVYACWSNQLPAVAARAAVCGGIDFSGNYCYRFQIRSRGRFGYFTKASKFERSTNDSERRQRHTEQPARR